MENKNELPQKLLCKSCLCLGRTLQVVRNEKMKQYYINVLEEIPLNTSPMQCPSICRECMALLRKAVAFREQVQDSYRILQTYTNENLNECLLTDVTRPPRLKVEQLETIDILPTDNVDSDVKGEPNEVELCCVKAEIKNEINFKEIETDIDLPHTEESSEDEQLSKIERLEHGLRNDSEHETDERFEQIEQALVNKRSNSELEFEIEIEPFLKDKKDNKKGKQIANKRKKLKKRNDKLSKPSKVDDKILNMELSYEEMMAEREVEASKDCYKHAKYKCETCIIGFTYHNSYASHMATKHSPDLGDYSCPICKTLFPGIEPFTAHYKRHVRRYVCAICQKRTVDMKVMQQHYYSTHEISLKQYTCSLCTHVSNSFDTHRYHMDTHKARLQCPECDKSFIHRAGLTNHRLAVHEYRNAFPCTICNKVFRWKTSLKRHLEKHDVQSISNTTAYCSTCEVSFSSVCSYQRHLKNSLKHVTQDQLRYICDHCNRRFADKTKLRDHIEEKHLHKTYQCHICLKPSKNRVGLDQHIRNVHRGRPNNKMCHHCGKGFPTKVQLESHIRTHTGERPFICEFCPTMFSQQSNLYKHNRQVHLNMKSKKYVGCKKRREDVEPTSTFEVTIDNPGPHKPIMAVLHYPSERYCPV